jgi:hypothetical protein
VNEAALLATRRGASEVAMTDFTSAIERILAGFMRSPAKRLGHRSTRWSPPEGILGVPPPQAAPLAMTRPSAVEGADSIAGAERQGPASALP